MSPLDHVIRRQQNHHRLIASTRPDDSGRQRRTGRRVARRRFADHVLLRQKRHECPDSVDILPVRDDENVLDRQELPQPLHRHFDHRRIPEKL